VENVILWYGSMTTMELFGSFANSAIGGISVTRGRIST